MSEKLRGIFLTHTVLWELLEWDFLEFGCHFCHPTNSVKDTNADVKLNDTKYKSLA